VKKLLGSFVLLCAAVAYAAGCSSHAAPSGWLPTQSGPVAGPGRNRRHHVRRATMMLVIPRRYRHRHWPRHGVRPHFISPATRSLTVAVSAGATSLPLQVFPVATPSPCTGTPTSGYTCQFIVDMYANAGNNLTLTTYAVASPNAASSPLSEFVTASAVTPPPSGGALGFTLEGVIAHVIMTYPTSSPNAAPWVDSAGQAVGLPAGVATTAPLSVIPYDEAGYQILSQYAQPGNSPIPYFNPITLSVSPSGSGIDLKNASGSGSSITIANPADLAVTVAYTGSVTIANGVVSPDAFTILASTARSAIRRAPVRLRPRVNVTPSPTPAPTPTPVPATPAPDVAYADLASNAVEHSLGAFSSPQPLGLQNYPGGGFMYTIDSGYAIGYVGRLSASGTVVSAGTLNFAPSTPFVDSLGEYWVYDSKDNRIDCFTGVGGTPSATIPNSVFLPLGATAYEISAIAQDASNDLWFSFPYYTSPYFQQSIGIAYTQLVGSSPCTGDLHSPLVWTSSTYSGTIPLVPIPGTNNAVEFSQPNAYHGSSSLGLLGIAQTPSPNPSASVAPTPDVGVPSPGPTVDNLASNSHAIYGANLGGSVMSPYGTSALYSVSGTHAVNVLSLPGILTSYSFGHDSPALSPSGIFALSGGEYLPYFPTVAMVDTTQSNPTAASELISVSQNVGGTCGGQAFDSNGTLWVLCSTSVYSTGGSATGAAVYQVLPTSTWSVFPGTTIDVSLKPTRGSYTCSPLTMLLSVLEKPSQDSGPFTMTKVSDPTPVVTAVATPQPGYDRGFLVTLNNNVSGTALYTLADKNGRSSTITFNVTSSATGTCLFAYTGGVRHVPLRGHPPHRRE
jgi:hypothetical protein